MAEDYQLKDFQNVLNYTFKNPGLLVRALTHSSYTNEMNAGRHPSPEDNNERLEFLGDAVLELVISEYIYNTYPELTEGEMTKLRASVVCEATLSEAAKALEMGRNMLMGRGEERTGGRGRGSILADCFEALAGAIFTDGGFAPAKDYIMRNLRDIVHERRASFMNSDYKTSLQEAIQRFSKEPLEYTVIDEVGPPHDRVFVVRLTHAGKTLSTGRGRSKKEAEQNCAKKALEERDNS
ncbi:MAG: ribonuclease III [Clostridiales bacterium]|jgi:ribonuclease-3|nr:ribonuclease III [Clostridiales bacterium]